MKLREPSVEYRSSSEPLRRPLNEVDDDAITGVRPDGTPVTPASAVTGCDAGVAEVLAGGASVGRRYSHEYKLATMPTVSFDSRAELSPEVIQQFIAKAGSPLTAKRVADALTQKAMALDSVGSALMMFYTPPVTGYEYRSLSHES